MRAGVYARLSKLRKGDEGRQLNLDGQVRRCREMAEALGWEVTDVYPDEDRPAAGRDPCRPEYERLVSDLRSGRINAVVALDQDRLVHEPYELELLLRVFEDTGARHLMTNEGEVTSEGVLHARIRASISAEEVRKMKARHKRKQEDIARDGRWGGGFRPFGFAVVLRPEDPRASNSGHVLEINEAEAELLRAAADRIISGESAEAIAQEWNASGVTTVTGRRWRGKSLRRLITAPSIAGRRVHLGEEVADAAWPPVLDRAKWEAVRAALAGRPEAKRGRPPREYLLTGGLAVCAKCGASLRARPRADGVRSYVCVAETRADGSTPCGGVRCVAEPLETLVFDAVLSALDADTDARRTELLELRADLAAIEQAQVPQDAPRNVDQLREWWPEAGLLQRRAFLRLFIEAVRVLPASHRGARFSQERAEFSWLR